MGCPIFKLHLEVFAQGGAPPDPPHSVWCLAHVLGATSEHHTRLTQPDLLGEGGRGREGGGREGGQKGSHRTEGRKGKELG